MLANEIARDGYRCSLIAIGAVTDAWQPIERSRLLTRRCLEVLDRTGHPATMVTKGSLIERDIDLLASMAARKQVFVMITLTTLDPVLARRLEPRAPAPWRRLQTLRRLAQARHVNYVVLRLPLELRDVFVDWLQAHFPDRAGRVMGRLRDMRGGQDSDARFGWLDLAGFQPGPQGQLF